MGAVLTAFPLIMCSSWQKCGHIGKQR